MRLVAVIVSWLLLGIFGGVHATTKPLTMEEVEELLREGVTPKRVVILIEEQGVTFEVTSALKERLRKAGADERVLIAIERASLALAQERVAAAQQELAERRKAESAQKEIPEVDPESLQQNLLEFIRAYYRDLDRRDVVAAKNKWAIPPLNLGSIIGMSDGYDIHSLRILRLSPLPSLIGAEVTAKEKGKIPKKYCVRIELVRSNTAWKIGKIKGESPIESTESCASSGFIQSQPLSSSVPKSGSCTNWRDAEVSCPLGFVRAYYEDLQRRDPDAAISKWELAPEQLRQLIINSDGYLFHDFWIIRESPVWPVIGAEVSARARGEEAKKYCSRIELVWRSNVWKIKAINGATPFRLTDTCSHE